MSLADQASLLLIPSGYKSQKLYSIFPTNGVGDFDFSRSGSATRIAQNGLITTVDSNVPRLNYPMIDGKVVGCPSLILEPQRTNLITHSEAFGNAAWSKTNSTITSDAVISPDGTLNADSIVGNGASGFHYILDSVTVLSGQDYTFSIFAKVGTNNFFQLNMGGAPFGSSNYCNFNLSNGTIGSFGNTTSNRFIEKLGDGWYRIGFTATTFSGGSANFFPMLITSATSSFLETNTLDTSIQIYGAMLEQSSHPTSYIKTSGSAVTRSAETANGAGDASTFNDSEGVLMVETKGENDGTFNYISLSDGGTQNYAGILYTDEDSQITYRYYVGGSGVQIIIENIIVTNFNKIAIKYKANDFAIWINGIEVGTASSGSLNPSGTFNQLAFARGGANNTPFYGSTKQLQYFDSALNDSDLEKLTSWVSFSDMANGQQYSIQ